MTLVWKLNVAWVLKFQGKERSKGGGFGGWLVFVSLNGSMKRENLLYMSFSFKRLFSKSYFFGGVPANNDT